MIMCRMCGDGSGERCKWRVEKCRRMQRMTTCTRSVRDKLGECVECRLVCTAKPQDRYPPAELHPLPDISPNERSSATPKFQCGQIPSYPSGDENLPSRYSAQGQLTDPLKNSEGKDHLSSDSESVTASLPESQERITTLTSQGTNRVTTADIRADTNMNLRHRQVRTCQGRVTRKGFVLTQRRRDCRNSTRCEVTSSKSWPWAWIWAWVWVCAALTVTPAEGKYVKGVVRTSEKWVFLTRFCFLSNDGTFSFEVEYDMEYATEKILLYYDSPNQWPAVYKSSKTCEQKEAVMRRENNQIINLTAVSVSSECEGYRQPGEEKAFYHCKGNRSFRSVRERWWFIALSNCESTKGLHLNYRFTLTNGYSYWYKHFSADEFYILRTDLTALALQTGILFLSLLASAELKNRQLLHTTYRLYMVAVVSQVFALLFLSLHYARYGYDGRGFPTSKLFGRLLHSLSTVMMVLLLLLMGKGFNITRGRLRQASAVRLTVFMCLYCATYVSLFIYEQQIFDPGEVLYLYQSPAGYGLLVSRFLAWLMFLYACFFTIKHYPEKGIFYYPFFIFYSLWFIAGPVVIIVSNHVIDKWVREKVVNGVDLSITLLGHAFFLFLTRPSAANRNFPYHVRTTQVMAMEASASGVVGNSTIDAFSQHRYAPDLRVQQDEYRPPGTPKNYTSAPDLFLVSGAVEMGEDQIITRPLPVPGPKSVVKDDKSFPHHPPGAPPVVFQPDSHPST